MRIGIDARELAGRATGVGRYLRALVRAWSEAGRDELLLYFNGARAAREAALELPGVRPRVASVESVRGLAWQEWHLPEAAAHDALDVFFAPAYWCPLRLALPRVTCVHDLSFFNLPQDFQAREALRRRLLTGASLAVSTQVLTVSDFSRREILALRPQLAGRVTVVPHGADDDLPAAPSREAARAALGVRGPYLLTVGSLFRRRRLPELLRAVALLRPSFSDLRLEVVGEDRATPPLEVPRLAREAGVAGAVGCTGFVDEAGLALRYAAADVAVFLSDYEGFGLPAMEACARGVPLVVSARPALSEVFAQAALCVDARDPQAVAAALHGLLSEPTRRAEHARRGLALAARHTWAAAAKRARAVLAAAAEEGRSLRPRSRAVPAEPAGGEASDGPVPPAGAEPAPWLSVVIVSYNTRDLLLECLAALEPELGGGEVLVVDNASHDGSVAALRARHPAVRLLVNRANLGFGRACNRGLWAARAPLVLFLNPDTRVQPGALARLAQRLLEDQRLGAVAPRTRHPDGAPQVSFGPHLSLRSEWRQRRLVAGVRRRDPAALARAEAESAREQRPDWLSAACLLARTAAVRALGGFDERFFLYEEDADLCRRLRAAGWDLLHLPAAEVVHHLGQATRQSPTRTRLHYQRSHLLYYRLHQRWPARVGLRALLLVEALGCLLAGPKAGGERRRLGRALARLALGFDPGAAVPDQGA